MMKMKPKYETPKDVYEKLDRRFRFTADLSSVKIGKRDADGPKINWKLRNFVKPSLGEDIHKWIVQALCACSKGRLVVMLLPARTDTEYFHKYILRYAREIWFVKGRLKFGSMKEGAPFPSMIVIFRRYPRGENIPIRIRSVNTKLTGIRSHAKRLKGAKSDRTK